MSRHHPGSGAWPKALAIGVLAGLGLSGTSPATAEIRKLIQSCPGKLCAYYLPDLPKPKGWIVETEATDANRIAVLVPAGTDFSSAEALIYGRAYLNTEKTSVEARAATSNEKWIAAAKGAKIERLPDAIRAKGGTPFQVFHYLNPENAQQKAELVAFGEDVDKEGNAYGVQIVLTTGSEAALKKNEAAFLGILKKY